MGRFKQTATDARTNSNTRIPGQPGRAENEVPDAHFLRVRNFEKYQSYNRQNLKQKPHPDWIKLYFALLADRMFYRLTDAHKFHVMGLFLIASQCDNRIPADLDWLQHTMGAKEKIDLTTLLASRFIEWVEPGGPETPALEIILETAKSETLPLLPLNSVSPLDHRESILGASQIREEKNKHIANLGSRDVSEDSEPQKKPAKNKQNDYTKEFDDFWKHSSQRGSKYEAFLVWQKLSAETRLTAGAAMIRACELEWVTTEERHIPHVVRWLRGRRWEVTPTEPKKTTRKAVY